jgi:hypothetical protein
VARENIRCKASAPAPESLLSALLPFKKVLNPRLSRPQTALELDSELSEKSQQNNLVEVVKTRYPRENTIEGTLWEVKTSASCPRPVTDTC